MTSAGRFYAAGSFIVSSKTGTASVAILRLIIIDNELNSSPMEAPCSLQTKAGISQPCQDGNPLTSTESPWRVAARTVPLLIAIASVVGWDWIVSVRSPLSFQVAGCEILAVIRNQSTQWSIVVGLAAMLL